MLAFISTEQPITHHQFSIGLLWPLEVHCSIFAVFTTHPNWGEGSIGAGSISVAIPPSCQDMQTGALYLHKHEYS